MSIWQPITGADPGEVKWVNFHPPFSEPPSFFFFLSPLKYWNIFLWSRWRKFTPYFKILDPRLHKRNLRVVRRSSPWTVYVGYFTDALAFVAGGSGYPRELRSRTRVQKAAQVARRMGCFARAPTPASYAGYGPVDPGAQCLRGNI